MAQANFSTTKIGVAKVDITPTCPVHFACQGNDLVKCKPPGDIKDHIFARVLYVKDENDNACIFISIDACLYIEARAHLSERDWTAPRGTRAKWAAAVGTSEDHVFVIPTHTHQAPSKLSDANISDISNRIKEAKNNADFVYAESVAFEEHLGVNRNPYYGINPSIPVDNLLQLIKFYSCKTHLPVAELFNYPIHNTAIGKDRPYMANQCSAELTGFTCTYLEKWFKKNVKSPTICLFLNGFYGDVGPNLVGPIFDPAIRERERGNPYAGFHSPGSQSYDVVKYAGIQLAKRIINNLRYGTAIELDTRTISTKIISITKETIDGWHNKTEDIIICAATIGDIGFIGVNADVFSQFGPRIRSNSRFPITITCSNTNDFRGYYVTREAYNNSALIDYLRPKIPFTGGIEDIIVIESIKLLDELYD